MKVSRLSRLLDFFFSVLLRLRPALVFVEVAFHAINRAVCSLPDAFLEKARIYQQNEEKNDEKSVNEKNRWNC